MGPGTSASEAHGPDELLLRVARRIASWHGVDAGAGRRLSRGGLRRAQRRLDIMAIVNAVWDGPKDAGMLAVLEAMARYKPGALAAIDKSRRRERADALVTAARACPGEWRDVDDESYARAATDARARHRGDYERLHRRYLAGPSARLRRPRARGAGRPAGGHAHARRTPAAPDDDPPGEPGALWRPLRGGMGA